MVTATPDVKLETATAPVSAREAPRFTPLSRLRSFLRRTRTYQSRMAPLLIGPRITRMPLPDHHLGAILTAFLEPLLAASGCILPPLLCVVAKQEWDLPEVWSTFVKETTKAIISFVLASMKVVDVAVRAFGNIVFLFFAACAAAGVLYLVASVYCLYATRTFTLWLYGPYIPPALQPLVRVLEHTLPVFCLHLLLDHLCPTFTEPYLTLSYCIHAYVPLTSLFDFSLPFFLLGLAAQVEQQSTHSCREGAGPSS
ncbi:hypothetical protein JCM8097_003951 [Rhodosporidiobolus ruineniae]